MARILKLSDGAMDALSRDIVPDVVDTGTLLLIHGYYGILPSQMTGDGGIF